MELGEKSPVIHLRFSQIAYQLLGLDEAISRELEYVAEGLNITLKEDNIILKLRELIFKASAYGKVVILIDEYDKPIIDYLDILDVSEENRKVFKGF